MNKVCNYRPIFFVCLSVLSALIFSYFMLLGNFFALYILIFIIMILIILLLFKFKLLKKKHFITIIICCVCFILAFSSTQIYANTFTKTKIEECQITGYISKINNGVITLTNIRADSCKLSKNATLYYSGEIQLKEGNIIRFTATLDNLKLVSNNEINFNMMSYNTAYSATLDNAEIIDYKPSFQMVVKEYVHSVLSKNYSDKNSALVFAMLFGDKSYLSEFDVTSYNEIGLAHIFAVSGLHISIIFMMIAFFLSKIKLKGKVNFILTACISIMYCYLCGFSASVVRATVMSLSLLFAKCVQKQGDSFNALCISFLILTLINPLTFLLKGFQLSFLCVFAILSLSPLLTRLFNRILPVRLSSTFAVSLSAFIGTFIVLIELYGFANPLSVIFNIFMIPLFSGMFMVIFVFTIITGIMPPLNFINQTPNVLLTIYNNLTEFLARNTISFNFSNLGVLCLLCFIIFMFVTGNFCLLTRYNKIIVSVCLLLICIISGFINCIPASFNYVSVTAIRSTYENCYIITSTDNTRVLMVNNLNSRSIKSVNEYITENNITYLSAVIAKRNNASQTQLDELLQLTKCDKLITLTISNNTFDEFEYKSMGNMMFSVLDSTLKEDVVVATINNFNILFCFSNLNAFQEDALINEYEAFNIICCKSESSCSLNSDKVIVFNQSDNQDVKSTTTENIIKLKL